MVGPIVIDDQDISSTACHYVRERKIVVDLNGRIHCVYWKVINSDKHVFHAYSDDDGLTWAKENITSGFSQDPSIMSIVVDSSGVVHIIYRDHGTPYNSMKYQHNSGGSWSTPLAISVAFGLSTPYAGGWVLGETVQGQTSGAEAILLFQWEKKMCVDNPYAGFQLNERIKGLTSGAYGKYADDIDSFFGTHGLAVDSNDCLHIAVSRSDRTFHLQRTSGGKWTHGDYVGIRTGLYAATIGIDANNLVHILVVRQSKCIYVKGSWNSWGATEDVADGGTLEVDAFSFAIDSLGNAHLALEGIGLGGANSGTLNIHYFKRSAAGVWGSVEHVTEDATKREDPSIAVDKNGNIRVVFRGEDYGVETVNPNIVMRTKPSGGSWGAVEVLVDRDPEQYLPNMLHSLFPKEDKWWGTYRPSYPDGFALIFNGQQSLDVEFISDIVPPSERGIVPTDLLCEQETNPTDVVDPQPEFSAIYHTK